MSNIYITKREWTLDNAKNDYRKPQTKTRKCANCKFASDLTWYCKVKNQIPFYDGWLKALFCKYYTNKYEEVK